MSNITLDQWKTSPNHKLEQGTSMSLEQANYLYESSYPRYIEKLYDWQIEQKLAEEKQELEKHKEYVKTNYIRIGGN